MWSDRHLGCHAFLPRPRAQAPGDVGPCHSHASSGPQPSPDMRTVSQEAQACLRKPSPQCGGRPSKSRKGVGHLAGCLPRGAQVHAGLRRGQPGLGCHGP